MKRSLVEKLFGLVDAFGALGMGLLTVLVISDTLGRYLFGHSFLWTSELTSLLFPWIVLLGAGSVTLNRAHLELNLLSPHVGPRGRQLLLFLGDLAVGVFSIYLFMAAFQLVKMTAGQKTPILFLSKGWLYLSVAAGALLMIAGVLARALVAGKERRSA